MNYLPAIIMDCLTRGIDVTLCLIDGKNVEGASQPIPAYQIDGFYKSGTVTLVPLGEGRYQVRARYDEISEIDSFEDLVGINAQWWERSRTRSDGWEAPHPKWVGDLVRCGYVHVETRTVSTYRTA